ncbi:potassium channel protein [Halobacteriales archaeon QS_1_68_17]|nr:MAG: potassium channel protein [Halobacteriales archaeon QS_1_68_17]
MAGDSPDRPADSALEELFYHTDSVPFVYWREFTGAKTTVLLTATIAVLSFIVGLSDLSQQSVQLDGPLAVFLPGSTELIRLYGVFFAFLIAGLTVGLQRQKRVAWYTTMIALPLVALLPLLTADATDVPLFLFVGLTYPLLLWNRSKFDESVDLSAFQLAALASFVGVQVYGTVGAYVMQENYTGIKTWTDAFYYIIVTGTTVGYGDATPTGQVTKLFTLSVIVLGTAAFTIASGSLLIPAIESRISNAFGNMTASELTLLEDHVLVLGYGDVTEPLLDELEPKTDLVVVTTDSDTATELKDEGVNVVTDDPTDTETLREARIDTARGVVIATEDDAQDVMAILAAKQANPDIRVVAAANDQQHIDKLEGVGADAVISPTVIGGRMLGRSVLGEAESLLDDADDVE